MLSKALKNALDFSDDAMFNIGFIKGSKHGVIDLLHEFKDKACDIIVWNKSQSMPSGLPSHRGILNHRCELVFCFNQTGSRSFSHPQWEIGTEINRIDTGNASSNAYARDHHATFPVEMPAKIAQDFSGQSVLDMFGGTGTTLIACEQVGRRCYMMELDPHFVDVTIQRWENMTGRRAERMC